MNSTNNIIVFSIFEFLDTVPKRVSETVYVDT